jgi:uncharacterized membrane protein YphA (DoxX/SURF4 family)
MTIFLLQIFVSLFLAILFLQSGLDKVFDFSGNLQFYNEHFASSPLKYFTRPMLIILAIMEITCGAFCLIGFFFILFRMNAIYSFYGSVLAAVDFLMLFFGQRVSKDYKGAAVLVSYFILSLIAIGVTSTPY